MVLVKLGRDKVQNSPLLTNNLSPLAWIKKSSLQWQRDWHEIGLFGLSNFRTLVLLDHLDLGHISRNMRFYCICKVQFSQIFLKIRIFLEDTMFGKFSTSLALNIGIFSAILALNFGFLDYNPIFHGGSIWPYPPIFGKTFMKTVLIAARFFDDS